MRKKKETTVEEVKVTEKQIVAAATNSPTLSEHEVEFGGKVYKLIDLPYDDYMRFLVLLQPLLESIVSKLTNNNMVGLADLVTYCGEAIPELVYLSLKQVDDELTISKIKEIGKTPFRLAPIVIKQMERNQVVKDISDFFEQILPLIRQIG